MDSGHKKYEIGWRFSCGIFLLLCRYPSDVDKHILARQTGLSRSQACHFLSVQEKGEKKKKLV